jgi:hypothetical protein
MRDAKSENVRLREGVECHLSKPGEGTYECRHDALCPACRLRGAEAELAIANRMLERVEQLSTAAVDGQPKTDEEWIAAFRAWQVDAGGAYALDQYSSALTWFLVHEIKGWQRARWLACRVRDGEGLEI